MADYKCGGCLFICASVSDLHNHLIEHPEGGNYFYNHGLKTAFPKLHCDSIATQRVTISLISKETQTDDIELTFIKREQFHDLIDPHKFNKVRLAADIVEKGCEETHVGHFANEKHSFEFDDEAAGLQYPTISDDVLIDADYIWNNEVHELQTPEVKSETYITIKVEKSPDGVEQQKALNKHRRKKKRQKDSKMLLVNDIVAVTNVAHKISVDTGTERKRKIKSRNKQRSLVEKGLARDIKDELNPFICRICDDERYTSRIKWERHIEKNHYHVYGMQCEKCFVPYVDGDEIRSHNCSMSFILTHACLGCFDGKEFRFKSNLLTHLKKEHNNIYPLKCQMCLVQLVSELDMKRHMVKHTSVLDCKTCNKCFNTLLELENHILGHTGRRRYTCHLCEKSYSSKAQLRFHFVKHDSVIKTYNCKRCGRSFLHTQYLQNHSLFCSGKKYACSVCNKEFAFSQRLKRHERIHTGEKPFLCDQCGDAFANEDSVKVHIRFKHTCEKKYKCNKCEKSFVTYTSLKRHDKVHMKINSYICEQCGKGFATNWNLKSHMRQHTGETPYKCSICGLGFAHNVVRKTHESKCEQSHMEVNIQKTEGKRKRNNVKDAYIHV